MRPGRTSRPAARRSALGGVVALGIAALAVQQQVVAVDLTFQAQPSEFSTSALDGADVAFATVPATVSDGSGATTTVPVLRGGFADATLDGLCVSQRQSVLGAPVTIKVTGGDGTAGTTDITSASATFDLTRVRGGQSPGIGLDGVVQIGQSAADVTTVPGVDNPLGAPTSAGHIAIDASSGRLRDLRGRVYGFAISEAPTIPGLRVEIVPGDEGCDASPMPH